MKKSTLFALSVFLFFTAARSQTTYTSPAGPATVTVSDAAGWNALPWVPVGSGTPYTYIIQPNYTIDVGPAGGHTVDLISQGNITINVQGKIGFYGGNNDLLLAATATVSIAAGGAVGYTGAAPCCYGNSSNNLVIGATNMQGPFHFSGPDAATGGTALTTSTRWTGATNTAWATLGNWSYIVPTAATNAIIPDAATTPNDPLITTSVISNKLLVLDGGIITINSGGGLTASGDVNVGATGSLTVKSGGSLVQTNNALLCTGTVNVERAIPAAVCFVSSPVSTPGVNSFGIATTGANGGQILTNQSTPCSATTIDPTSPYGNLMEMREDAVLLTPAANCAQELWFVKSAGNLENGRGYSLTKGGVNTLTFSGTANTGTITYANLTRTGIGTINNQGGFGTPFRGWHLVGNPYPSPITINVGFLLGEGFDDQLFLYQHNGAYTGTWISVPAVSMPVTIAVGQSFQIHKTAAGGTVNFTLTNANRVVGNPTFYKINLAHYLKVSINNGTLTDTTTVFFYPGATPLFDPAYDANRLADGYQRPMIYSVVNSIEMLSYNALPEMNFGDSATALVGVRTEIPGAHTLTFNGVSSLYGTLILEDLKLNTKQSVAEGEVYNFTTVAGDNRERFILHFYANASGISEYSSENVKMYPNPASGITTLVLTRNHGFSTATITDVFGRNVLAFELNPGEPVKDLDVSKLASGVYSVKLTGSLHECVSKLVIQ